MFEVLNFNDVKDQRDSVFVQWSPQYDSTQYGNQSYSIGLRIKQNRADANNVSSSMAMMMPAVKALQTQFNQADKNISDTTYDIAFSSKIDFPRPFHGGVEKSICKRNQKQFLRQYDKR